MGAVNIAAPPGTAITYAAFNFPTLTSKWSVVARQEGGIASGTDMGFQSVVVVGQLNQVAQDLASIMGQARAPSSA
jgi:hypothetical protein